MLVFSYSLFSVRFIFLVSLYLNTWTRMNHFSSPELKAQVSFSDHLSTVVCLSIHPSVRPSVRLSVCKLHIFIFFSNTTWSIQQNLTQSIPWCRGFKFVQRKGHARGDNWEIIKLNWQLFQKGDNYKVSKIHWWNKKKSFSPGKQSQCQPT